jgi:hypothetical protein
MHMKQVRQIVVVVALSLVGMGCASTKGYFADRWRDTCDVVSVTGGIGLGVKARVGPLDAGLLYNMEGVGVRNGVNVDIRRPSGEFGGMEVNTFLYPMKTDSGRYYWAVEMYPLRTREPRPALSSAGSVNMLPFVSVPVSPHEGEPTPTAVFIRHFSQVEVAVGLGPSLRVGLGLGEIVDFLLGWTGVDIFDDDEGDMRYRRSNQASQDIRGPEGRSILNANVRMR